MRLRATLVALVGLQASVREGKAIDPRTFITSSTPVDFRRLGSDAPVPTEAPGAAPAAETAATNRQAYHSSVVRWSFVLPIISLSFMAWAMKRHKLIVCCGDDIPDEIVVPRSSDVDDGDASIVGDRDTDIEMQPPHYWTRYQMRFDDHDQDISGSPSETGTDISSLKGCCAEDNEEDDSTTNGFVLMLDHHQRRIQTQKA